MLMLAEVVAGRAESGGPEGALRRAGGPGSARQRDDVPAMRLRRRDYGRTAVIAQSSDYRAEEAVLEIPLPDGERGRHNVRPRDRRGCSHVVIHSRSHAVDRSRLIQPFRTSRLVRIDSARSTSESAATKQTLSAADPGGALLARCASIRRTRSTRARPASSSQSHAAPLRRLGRSRCASIAPSSL